MRASRSWRRSYRRAVLERDVAFTDDAPVPLQVKGNGKLKKARLWVYVRGGPGPPLVAYDFSIDRSKKRPLDFFKDYQGYVHADAYSGYDELFKKEGIIEVGCWAHARRKFDEAASSRPKEATDILARIARLYHEVETPCAGMEPEERRRFRQEHAAPLLAGIFAKLEETEAPDDAVGTAPEGHRLRPESKKGPVPLPGRRAAPAGQQPGGKRHAPRRPGTEELALRGKRTGRPGGGPVHGADRVL